MGLDLTLGALIVLAALRGWFRGFFAQAIRLGGLVGCVYLAAPLRDLIQPAAIEYLPSIRPELLDKLLWWASAVLAFVVLTGLATWVLKAAQRRGDLDRKDAPSYRGDQSAGALLGAAKGAITVAFIVAGVGRYAPQYLEKGGWVGEQVVESRALALSEQHQPAMRIWQAEPVQNFIEHVRRMGIDGEGPETESKPEWQSAAGQAIPRIIEPPKPAPAPSIRTAQRPKPLELPRIDPLDPESPDFDLEAAMNRLQQELKQLQGP